MTIEDNMKIATGLRRMGVMQHEVAKVEELLAEGKTAKEVADIMLCDESVIEGFRPSTQEETNAEQEEDNTAGGRRGRRK